MAAISSISTLITLMRDRNNFFIWRKSPVVTRYIRLPPLFPISILQKQLQIYMLSQMPLKNGCNNFYFDPYNLDKNRNHFLIWCHFSVVAQYILEAPLFPISMFQKQLQIYLLFQMSLNNGCNDLYFHPYNLHSG